MLRDGVINLSTSPYCTYPVLAAKKDGGIRFAIDYRKVNEVTVADKTPLPRIEDLIDAVESGKFFAQRILARSDARTPKAHDGISHPSSTLSFQRHSIWTHQCSRDLPTLGQQHSLRRAV